MLSSSITSHAEPAVDFLGKDFIFPHTIEGMPEKLSDFSGLSISSFKTNDGVSLAYWEAGSGQPLIFLPAWGSNGAEHFNLIWLLSKDYHVYVLDPRNQGLSEKTEKGIRISRFSMDLKEFVDHVGVEKAIFSGWSMGASVLWGYIDLFGTNKIKKAIFVDEPISIYTHSDWSEQERSNAGGMTTSAEKLVQVLGEGVQVNNQVVNVEKLIERLMKMDSPYAQNALGLSQAVVDTDPNYTKLVLFDHATNDWSDVIRHKLDVPVAVFSGVESANLPSQKWLAKTALNATLFEYSSEDNGDHFMMLKNPVKFSEDLREFIEK